MDNKTQIEFLQENIEQLISMHKALKKENVELKALKISLKHEAEQINNEKLEIEKKFERLKLAKTIEISSEDTHDAKIKINKIVREIDDCIALMNK